MLPNIVIKSVGNRLLQQKFCCNKIFLLLFKIIYCNKKYNCYNLLQKNFCCDRLPIDHYKQHYRHISNHMTRIIHYIIIKIS